MKGHVGDIASIYPFKPTKKKQREESAVVIVIKRGDELYLEKKEKGLLAGLYDFPTMLDADPISKAEELKATTRGSTNHLFSHIRRTSHVLTVDAGLVPKFLIELQQNNTTGRWVDHSALKTIGVSELCLKNSRMALGNKRAAIGDDSLKSKSKAKVPAIFNRKRS